MASTTPFACGDEDPSPSACAQPPPRAPRRPTGGLPPPPPPMRHGWQGGKPPPGTLQRDIAARGAAEQVGNFSDDEDFMRGDAIIKRRALEEKKRKREPELEVLHEESDEDDDDEDDDDGEWYAHPPPPLTFPSATPVSASSSSSSSSSAPTASASGSTTVSELMMKCAVEQAFRSGIEEGKKMQLPQQCKTCAIRKERNRIAAKESRYKKRVAADDAATRILWAKAAEETAKRAAATVSVSTKTSTGGAEEVLIPPEF